MRTLPFILGLISCTSLCRGAIFPEYGPTTGGSHASLRGVIALAPDKAPLVVKRAIWAANQLRSKPYRLVAATHRFVTTDTIVRERYLTRLGAPA